jgi:hypothetical protein
VLVLHPVDDRRRVDAVVPAEPAPVETGPSPLERARGLVVGMASVDGRLLPIIDPVALVAAVTRPPAPAPDLEAVPAR